MALIVNVIYICKARLKEIFIIINICIIALLYYATLLKRDKSHLALNLRQNVMI